MAQVLRGTDLRYALTRLLQLSGPCSIAELVVSLQNWGFSVAGRPSKTVSDALRWEMRRDRVRRRGRGIYGAGGMPRSTEHRIITRVLDLRDQAAGTACRSKVGATGRGFPRTDVAGGP